MTADKIQRWALYVSQFCYKTMVKRRHDKNADFFPKSADNSPPTTETEHYGAGCFLALVRRFDPLWQKLLLNLPQKTLCS